MHRVAPALAWGNAVVPKPAYGGHGELVDEPDRLADVLAAALKRAAAGAQSLVAVRVT